MRKTMLVAIAALALSQFGCKDLLSLPDLSQLPELSKLLSQLPPEVGEILGGGSGGASKGDGSGEVCYTASQPPIMFDCSPSDDE